MPARRSNGLPKETGRCVKTIALSVPGAVLVTADRRYFAKAQHLGQIAWLADFSCPQ